MARLSMSAGWQEQVLRASAPTMREIGNEIATHYRDGVGVDTGHLKQSIFSSTEANGDTRVGATADYARAHEFGTKPHRIEPTGRNVAGEGSNVLAFQSGGKTVFAKGVNHPGTEENPALGRAITAIRAKGRFHA